MLRKSGALAPDRLSDVAAQAAVVRLAEPPTLSAAVPNWAEGDMIHLGHRTLRVVGRRDDDEGQPPVLVVEDMAQ